LPATRWPLLGEITGRDSTSSARGHKSRTCPETHFPAAYRLRPGPVVRWSRVCAHIRRERIVRAHYSPHREILARELVTTPAPGMRLRNPSDITTLAGAPLRERERERESLTRIAGNALPALKSRPPTDRSVRSSSLILLALRS